MWRSLPQQGATMRKLETHRTNEVLIVPLDGERIRMPVRGTCAVETVGHVIVRTAADKHGLRVTFTADTLVLERAEVSFDGDDREWQELWRRARMRSLPWWRNDEADEIDLDGIVDVRLRIVGTAAGASPSWPPPPPR